MLNERSMNAMNGCADAVPMPADLAQRTREVAARLDRLPATPFIWKLVCLLSLGGFFEFYDLFLTAYIAPGLIQSGIFAKTTASVFAMNGIAALVAATFIGLFIGTMGLGFLPDRFGRRKMFVIALLAYTVANIAMACQHTALGVNVFRLLAGIGLGVEMITINTYIAELMPKGLRGRAFALTEVIWLLSVPVVSLLAWWLVPQQPFGIDGWRWVVLASVAGAIVVWFIRLNIPESPRWLLTVGRIDEATAVTDAIETTVRKEYGRELPTPVPYQAAIAPIDHRFRDIISGRYLKRTVMMSFFNFFSVIGFYGFSNWVPTLLMGKGVSVPHSLQYSFLMSIALPLGPALIFWLADKVERKWTMVVSSGAIAVSGIAFSAQTSSAGLVACGFLLNVALTIMSYSQIAYQSEIYPTDIRARAFGFVYSWSRFGAIFSGFLVSFFLHGFGTNGVFAMISSCMVINMLLITVMGPLTKGRTVEELN